MEISHEIVRAAELTGEKLKIEFICYARSKEHARELVRELGGHFKKGSANALYWISRIIEDTPRVRQELTIFIPSMCQRVQVGEKEIPAVPEQPAHVEPVYEYRCDSLFEVEG